MPEVGLSGESRVPMLSDSALGASAWHLSRAVDLRRACGVVMLCGCIKAISTLLGFPRFDAGVRLRTRTTCHGTEAVV